MNAAENNLVQITRLQSVDQLYTKMLRFCGACAIGAGLGAILYGVLAYASGSL